MSKPSLRVRYLDKRFRVLLTDKPLSIGRLKENRLCIEIGSISRRHAVIEAFNDTWVVRDLGSSNGIVYNNTRVRTLRLKSNMSFRLGDAFFSTLIDNDDTNSPEAEQDLRQTRIIEDGTKLSVTSSNSLCTPAEVEPGVTRESALSTIQNLPTDIMEVGSEIAGYRIEKQLHSDNLQTSYQAHQLSIDRRVVLKVLNTHHTEHKPFVEKFAEQAKVSGSYNHPNIVHTLDCNQVDDIFFYTVEWVDGSSLSKLILNEKRLSVTQSLDIIHDISQALQYIHLKGATHQNLKPDSVFVKENGEAKLADVGLFALFDSDATMDSRRFVGSPLYMSPEQIAGKTLSDRSDIYSLGAILYHMITNRAPYEGGGPGNIIPKQLQDLPDPPQNFDITISEHLNNLIMEMLQKDPQMRPPIDKVLGLLPDIQTEALPSHETERSTMIRRRRIRRKRRSISALTTTLPFVIVLILAYYILGNLDAHQRSFALKKAPWLQPVFSFMADPTDEEAHTPDFITFENMEPAPMNPVKDNTSRMNLRDWEERMGDWASSKKVMEQNNLGGGEICFNETISLKKHHLVLRVESILYPLSLKYGDDLQITLNSSGLRYKLRTSHGEASKTIELNLKVDTPIRLLINTENDTLEIGINSTRIYRGVVAGLGEIEARPALFAGGPLDIKRFEF